MVSLTLLQIAIAFIAAVCASKKYDLDKEALKLYGMSPQSIVEQFRRTPAYLEILRDKIAGIKLNFENMIKNLIDVHITKFKDEIREWVTSKKSKGHSDADNEKEDKEGPPMNLTLNVVDTTGAEFLENHGFFKSCLTLDEKKKAKEIAFEHMQLLINTLKKYMVPEDNAVKSTLLLFDDESTKSTAHIHFTQKITSEEDTPSAEDKTLRLGTYFRYGINETTIKIKIPKTPKTTKAIHHAVVL